MSSLIVARQLFCADVVAGPFALPKGQQIQPGNREILTTPGDVNSNDINLSLGHLGKTRDHVNEVLKAADIARICILQRRSWGLYAVVHPTVDVNEKERALCLANCIHGSDSLRHGQGRALISEFYEGEFVPTIGRASYRVEGFTRSVCVIRAVWSAAFEQRHYGQH